MSGNMFQRNSKVPKWFGDLQAAAEAQQALYGYRVTRGLH